MASGDGSVPGGGPPSSLGPLGGARPASARSAPSDPSAQSGCPVGWQPFTGSARAAVGPARRLIAGPYVSSASVTEGLSAATIDQPFPIASVQSAISVAV